MNLIVNKVQTNGQSRKIKKGKNKSKTNKNHTTTKPGAKSSTKDYSSD